jgi:tetratricopeptide (TPR) repeat protein
MLYTAREEYIPAEVLFKRALEINEKAFGPANLEVAAIAFNLATVYRFVERHEEAEALEKRAIDIRDQYKGDG